MQNLTSKDISLETFRTYPQRPLSLPKKHGRSYYRCTVYYQWLLKQEQQRSSIKKMMKDSKHTQGYIKCTGKIKGVISTAVFWLHVS